MKERAGDAFFFAADSLVHQSLDGRLDFRDVRGGVVSLTCIGGKKKFASVRELVRSFERTKGKKTEERDSSRETHQR